MRKRQGSAVRGDEADLNDLTSLIFKSSIDPSAETEFLERTARALGSRSSALFTVDTRDLSLGRYASHNIPADGWDEYAEYYLAEDPRVPAALQKEHFGKIMTDYDITTEEKMQKSPYYEDFLKRRDFRYYAATSVPISSNLVAAFSVQRSASEGHVDRSHVEFLQRLAPHVQAALQVRTRIGDLERHAQRLENALDRLQDIVLVVDSDGRLLHANEAGQALMAAEEAVRLRRGRVEHCNPAAQSQWRRAIEHAARIGVGQPASAPALFRIPLGEQRWLAALVTPGEPGPDGEPTALAILSDPLAANGIDESALAEAFGLTRKESEVLALVAGGFTAREIADELGITHETVRIHLKNIYSKTHLNRQSELARVVARLPGVQPRNGQS